MNQTLKTTPLHYPAYLLLTSKFIYIARPIFRLSKLEFPFKDEQTSYHNPSQLFKFFYQLPIQELSRIDVGPGRQYLVFHHSKRVDGKEDELTSLVFQTRSKQSSTIVVDAITMIIHEDFESCNLHLINQDVEWCMKSLQDYILLRPGEKSTTIMTHSNVWETESLEEHTLSLEEYDSGINERITKVDFEFCKLYLLCAYLRYVKPTIEAEIRGVEIQHVTLLSTREYIYLLEERLDVWPPAVFPLEISTIASPLVNLDRAKGFLIDKIPQFKLLGVGRIKDITRIERWRSWRIDSSFGCDFKGLGANLQNGHIGFLNQSTPHLKQQASSSGWFWWVRVCFGWRDTSGLPNSSPNELPNDGYWWDLAFSYRGSSDDLLECIKALRGGSDCDIDFVLGDD